MKDYLTLTPESINLMTDDEVKAKFTELGILYFQKANWRTDFARLIGQQPRTVGQWFDAAHRPRVWALLFLQALANEQLARMVLQQLGDSLSEIDRLS